MDLDGYLCRHQADSRVVDRGPHKRYCDPFMQDLASRLRKRVQLTAPQDRRGRGRAQRRATVAVVSGDYRSVIIGASGGRARGHALAYRYQARARLVAVSARTAGPRDKLAADYGVAARYDDYREMLERERPHLVHVNTPPSVRLEVLEQVAAAGVPAAIVEKPIAVDGPDCARAGRLCSYHRAEGGGQPPASLPRAAPPPCSAWSPTALSARCASSTPAVA